MRSWSCALLVVVACSEPPPSASGRGVDAASAVAPVDGPAPVAAPVQAAPRRVAQADDSTAIPEDWAWITDTRGRFEVAMPRLPRMLSAAEGRGAEELALVSETGGARYLISSSPAQGDAPLDGFRQTLAQAGSLDGEAPWRGHGLAWTLVTPRGRSQVRAVVEGERLYALRVSGAASAALTERFFSSFAPGAMDQPVAVGDPERGYAVQAPARMGRWRDTSAVPELVGHSAVVDGHQLAVSVHELGLVLDANAALDGGIQNMVRDLDGAMLDLDPRPLGEHPSRRAELRAGDGMYATVRLVLDGSRLYTVSVYSPSGRQASWADAYVDSLVVER